MHCHKFVNRQFRFRSSLFSERRWKSFSRLTDIYFSIEIFIIVILNAAAVKIILYHLF